MKKFIITLAAILLAILSNEAKAQLVYTPYNSGSSSSSSSVPEYNTPRSGYPSHQNTRPSVQRTRTTAYCWMGGDNFGKLPIIVEYGSYGASVVQVYQAAQSLVYGASQGRWVEIYPAEVKQCYPDLNNHPLEGSFMYKANIQGRVYYFDL